MPRRPGRAASTTSRSARRPSSGLSGSDRQLRLGLVVAFHLPSLVQRLGEIAVARAFPSPSVDVAPAFHAARSLSVSPYFLRSQAFHSLRNVVA